MWDVFLNYRRGDKHAAGRLYDHLTEFSVFMDKDIPPGRDYRTEIRTALSSVRVVIAVIGAQGMSVWNLLRLRRKEDWVRYELATALKRSEVVIVPVLVDEGVGMPSAGWLPEDMREFSTRNAIEIRADKLKEDIKPLLAQLRLLLPPRGSTAKSLAQAMAPDAPFLCDRIPQEDNLEELVQAAKQTRSLFLVVHGHKLAGHDEFLDRLQQRRKLEKLFDSPANGVDVRRLHWDPDRTPVDKRAEVLRAVIKRSVFDIGTEDDAALTTFLTNPGRPVVFTLQVTWPDLQRSGTSLLKDFETAWKQMIAQVKGTPAHPLVLWINLTYDHPTEEFKAEDVQKLEKLRPLRESHIQDWFTLDEVRAHLTPELKIQLTEVARNPKYSFEPDQIHMLRFAQAVHELMPKE
jgi:hypothetical protein